jgi:serine/threonine-protein kinase HipA
MTGKKDNIKILDVYFNKKMAGHLVQDQHGDMNFTYSADWLNDRDTMQISCSLPLQKETFNRKSCQAFFGGLLPEEHQRKLIAKNLGISANNDFSMLEKIGGECAGALSFVPTGYTHDTNDHRYYKLTDTALADILRELPSRPLLAGAEGVRLSLAGVQDKLAVYVKANKIYIPLSDSPSTHILKPDFNIYEGVIFNEAFCLKLAQQAGLLTVDAEIHQIEDIHYLLVRRYDRINTGTGDHPGTIKRLHQEDFCQALGISSANKYQNEGGPSLKQCFDLIRAESARPVIDLQHMMDAVIFNWIVGNCDAHGKNFSFLYPGQLHMAPLYDVICTIVYKDLSQKMAMKLGGQYQINHIVAENFDKLAEAAGFSKPETRRRIHKLIDAILSSLQTLPIEHPVQQAVAQLIEKRCRYLAGHLKPRPTRK